jgi:hypothetical protein
MNKRDRILDASVTSNGYWIKRRWPANVPNPPPEADALLE